MLFFRFLNLYLKRNEILSVVLSQSLLMIYRRGILIFAHFVLMCVKFTIKELTQLQSLHSQLLKGLSLRLIMTHLPNLASSFSFVLLLTLTSLWKSQNHEPFECYGKRWAQLTAIQRPRIFRFLLKRRFVLTRN